MANKTVQLLRNKNVITEKGTYDDVHAAALAALNAQLAAVTTLDGQPVLVRYNDGSKERTILGIKGKTGTEIFDNVAGNDAITAAINALDATVNSTGGANVAVQVVETDGKITGVTVTTDNTINSTDLENAIAELDASDAAVSGKFVTAVSEADGKITVSRDYLTDAVLAGYAADTTKTGAIAATDTLEQALNKLENKTAAITVASADKTVKVTSPAGGGTDLAVNIDGTTLVKDSSTGAISTNLKIVKNSSPSDTSVKEEYYLAYGSSSTAIGDTIKIYKDSALLSIKLLHAYHVGQADEILPTYSNGTWTDIDSQYQTEENVALCYAYSNATGDTVIAAVPVGNFLQESEFGNGLQVVSGEVSVKIDSESEDFLSVSSNGVKVSGVQDAIDAAVEALDANVSQTAGADGLALSITEVAGKITAISGSIAAETYDAYGSAAAVLGESTDAATANTVYGAKAYADAKKADVIGESTDAASANTIYGAKAYANAAIAALDKSDTAVTDQFVTAVSESDGVISVTRIRPTAANVSFSNSYFDPVKTTNVEDALIELAEFDCGTY